MYPQKNSLFNFSQTSHNQTFKRDPINISLSPKKVGLNLALLKDYRVYQEPVEYFLNPIT